MYQRILILAHHGIGDVLMILPLLKSIRKKYPKAKIIITVKSTVEQSILQDTRVGDEYLYLAPSKLSWIERIQLISKLRREGIDLAISTYGINKRLSSILFTLISAKSTVGFTNGRIRIPFDIELTPTGEHKVKENLKIAGSLGIKGFNVDNEWQLNSEDIDFAENLFHEHGLTSDSTVIGVHPGCGEIEKHKRWPLDHFRNLISIVANYDYPIFTFGGPGEEYLTNYIIKGQKGRLINMAGILSLGQTAALIKKCAIMLGGDSGLIHVATSVKTPVIAIFGPTDPSITGPYGEHVRIIQSEQECCPCYSKKMLTGCKNPICMQSVSVDTVWQIFQKQVQALIQNLVI
ncbi:glycosyltransferase family 9 protein [bacterium]|nr:glycosyltransferase family 9 protein [bacterium]